MKASPQGVEAGAKLKKDGETGHYGDDHIVTKAITVVPHESTRVSAFSCYLGFFKDFVTKLI